MSPLHRRVPWTLVALLLILSLGAGLAAAGSDPFAPVPADHWAYSALETLQQAGLLESPWLATGLSSLTRYEVADLLAQAADALEAAPASFSLEAQARVALAWLYRVVAQLDQAAAHPTLLPLDQLQALRQLSWLSPTTTRLSRRLGSGASGDAAAVRVREEAWRVYQRLQELVPAGVALVQPPQEAGLERALAYRMAAGGLTPAELADRVEVTSRALRSLGRAFEAELKALEPQRAGSVGPEARAPAGVVTLEELRRATGLETDEARIPLGQAGDLEAWLGVDPSTDAPGVQPQVNVGLEAGSARLHAGWRLLDFSSLDLKTGSGEAGVQLRF